MNAIDWSAAELPSTVERLDNGLIVIVHAEPKAPLAAVFVGYRVGSRDEPPSKAGLAHLCEHLMFSGTTKNPGSYFAPFEQIGASSMNAFVREDYSAYFATVPATSLEFALMMEADRMANVSAALNADKIERERKVVLNELRQREGSPYGCSARILAELTHPVHHPYAHEPDGLIRELGNITLDDVVRWLESRHCPVMATLVVAGDVEPARVVAQAERHFGSLAQKVAVPRPGFVVRSSPLALRRQIEQTVPHCRLYVAWYGPGCASTEYPGLELACETLAGPRSSRLWRRLVEVERLTTDVQLELRPREMGTLIVLAASARIGVPLSAIEEIARREIERLVAQGPEANELEVARLRLFGKMVRGFEQIGGAQSKSDTLGFAAIACGGLHSHRGRLSALSAMPPQAVADACQWLAGASAVLEISPSPHRNGR
jgi:zinc protease